MKSQARLDLQQQHLRTLDLLFVEILPSRARSRLAGISKGPLSIPIWLLCLIPDADIYYCILYSFLLPRHDLRNGLPLIVEL